MSKKKGKAEKPTGRKHAAAKAEKPTEAKAKKTAAAPKAERPKVDLEALRKPVADAKARLDKAQAETKELIKKAQAPVAEAREAFLKALAPYREACHKAKAPCEFSGSRGENVSEKVKFVVEKTDKGVWVTVKGKPKTEEVIPLAALKESINKAAYAYTDKHLGPKEEIGNKGGSLSNRLRAVLNS
jgi:hypothetical protein